PRGEPDPGLTARLVDVPAPVERDAASRSRGRLVGGMGVRRRELRAVQRLLGREVPEPVLAGLEAPDHRVAGLAEVGRRVLGRGGVAAADVAALRAAAQVHPPAAGLLALDAAGAARGA